MKFYLVAYTGLATFGSIVELILGNEHRTRLVYFLGFVLNVIALYCVLNLI